MDFEKKLTELEAIVDKMEAGELSLDDSLKSFEKGVKLSRECNEALNKAELKVKKLLKAEEGSKTEDFDVEE